MTQQTMCRLHFSRSNKPGVLARLGNIFAERGINIQEMFAGGGDAKPVILITFSASESLLRYLKLRLERMAGVESVTLEPISEKPLREHIQP